jgi:flavin reductase (DIM6/NTAB) family NADH-FMN oxidoreductase RutF
VVNIATWDLRDAVILSSNSFPPSVDEFEACGLTKVESHLVSPFRVAESPIQFECKYHQTVTLPANRRDTIHRIVIGAVIGVHIKDEVINSEGRVDILKIRPLARVGYQDYTSVTEILEIRSVADQASHVGEAVAVRRRP